MHPLTLSKAYLQFFPRTIGLAWSHTTMRFARVFLWEAAIR